MPTGLPSTGPTMMFSGTAVVSVLNTAALIRNPGNEQTKRRQCRR